MTFDTTILNFTGIYEQESFYLSDKSSRFIDLKGISGTNCMCDDAAKEVLMGKMGESAEADKAPDGNVAMPEGCGVHFLDNGNYHYVSALYLSHIKEPFSLVVLDHHPDMQRPMFDILSCGGWILDVLEKNEYVRDVHIIGADRTLISEIPVEDRKRVRFYDAEDVFVYETGATIGAGDDSETNGNSGAGGGSVADVDSELLSHEGVRPCKVILPDVGYPVYLSIDKDVIRREEITTNWDQGELTRQQVLDFVEALITETAERAEDDSGTGPKTIRLLGVDICGECAPDQEGINIESAVRENDEFNRDILNVLM